MASRYVVIKSICALFVCVIIMEVMKITAMVVVLLMTG